MRWLRTWLGCVAPLYPAWVAGTVIALVIPPLVLRRSIEQWVITPLGIAAITAPENTPGWRWLIVAAVCAALLAIRRWPGLTGLVIVAAGCAASWPMLRGGRGNRMPWLAGALIVAAGLRMFLRAVPAGSYGQRVLFLITGVAGPLAAIPLLFRAGRFPQEALYPALVVGCAAFVAAFRVREGAAAETRWRAIAAAAVVSIALGFVLPRAGESIAGRQRLAEREAARAILAELPPAEPGAPYPAIQFHRGVSYTAEFPAGYSSSTARETLRLLPAYGVDSIALVPYGNISNPRRFGGGWESDEGIEMMTRLAHSLNMKVMLKPQLWGRTWPADFEPENDDARREWFEGYAVFVDHYAALASRLHVDLFCIGTELAKMTRHEQQWRDLIERARARYAGPITYGAIQGTEFETLRFWDALDYIGLSNYYPLPDSLDTSDVVKRVEAVHRRFNKPVLFVEAGFSTFEAPHRQPWDETPRRIAPDDQARCYEALFRAFYEKAWFQGFYWWKVGTNGYGGPQDGSHTPWRKPAMEVVRRWYTRSGLR